MGLAQQAAPDIAEALTWREQLRWVIGDKCAALSRHPGEIVRLVDELQNHFGISITATSLSNYARVANAFSKEHRHLQYKWSNYLAWSKWDNPVEAMKMALDSCLSPRQMDKLRTGKQGRKPKCKQCGGKLDHCKHDVS